MKWINGQPVMSHEIGHLPFLAEVTAYLKYGKENHVTVAVDNTLLPDTVPQGRVIELERFLTKTGDFKADICNCNFSGRLQQSITFDFFNYAGIHRPVKLYTTPKTYVDDITVFTTEATDELGKTRKFLPQGNFSNNFPAKLKYNVTIEGGNDIICRVSLSDKWRAVITTDEQSASNCQGILSVENPKLWWPYLMDPEPGYLYSFEVKNYFGRKQVFMGLLGGIV